MLLITYPNMICLAFTLFHSSPSVLLPYSLQILVLNLQPFSRPVQQKLEVKLQIIL